ncbi:NXPE family member 3-like [Anguilla rostrata]|uniref:NXPE family member 3-like n=1 Tax=Anguilla rostrata TaxID=7938 RepID=UPI0030CCD18E
MNLIKNEMRVLLMISPVILFVFSYFVYVYDKQSEAQGKPPAPVPCHNLHSAVSSSPVAKQQPTAEDATQNLPASEDAPSEIGSEERAALLASLWWPPLNKTVSSVAEATDGAKCSYRVIDLRENYTVGGVVRVVLVARDGNGRPKTHGGDFFQAKLHNSGLKASTFGPVVDHLNGTYTVQFSLLWPGPAYVSIRLIHSSEAVQVIRRQRQQDPDKVCYFGYFVDGSRTETVVCNALPTPWLVGDGTGCCCQYTDPVTRESWFCRRPPSLPCRALIYHSSGRYQAKLSKFDASILHKTKTNVILPGRDAVIHVLPQDEDIRDTRPQCRPGLGTAMPAGFYFQDRWTSLQCRSRSFPTPALVSACLRDKQVYMLGDSTLRQWFEYLESAVPTLKRLDLHTERLFGPRLAVDPQSNTLVQWRPHGLPVRMHRTPVADLHYIAREVQGMGGGEHTVVVLNIWAHFTTHPLDYYIRRLATIRPAVRALLQRSPRTLVAIKTANTGYKDVYGSDWLSWQLDLALRAMFRTLPVVFVDAWQMTSCHYSPDNLHPPREVVMNEVDLFLSFVCPQ